MLAVRFNKLPPTNYWANVGIFFFYAKNIPSK